MDLRGCILVLIVVVNCVCLSLVAASQENDSFQEQYGKHPSLRGNGLEQKLREDIERELVDVRELERQLISHLNLITEKKRQLEIKKRQPVQCLVNIVSCWKRK